MSKIQQHHNTMMEKENIREVFSHVVQEVAELKNRYEALEEKLRLKQEELDRAREAIQVIQGEKKDQWTGSCLPADLKEWFKD